MCQYSGTNRGKYNPTVSYLVVGYMGKTRRLGFTLGEVTKRRPASAAASKRPKFDTGFTMAAEIEVRLGAGGTEAAGIDSSIGLLGTGGGDATGVTGAAAFPISRFTRILKAPTCHEPKL